MADGWVVTHQDPKPTLSRDGRFMDTVEIHYRVTAGPASGHEDSITVTADQYADIRVIADLIASKVASNNAVADL